MPAVRYRIVALKDVLEALKQDKPAEPEPPLESYPAPGGPKSARPEGKVYGAAAAAASEVAEPPIFAQGTGLVARQDAEFTNPSTGRKNKIKGSAPYWVASSVLEQREHGTVEVCKKGYPKGHGFHLIPADVVRLFAAPEERTGNSRGTNDRGSGASRCRRLSAHRRILQPRMFSSTTHIATSRVGWPALGIPLWP